MALVDVVVVSYNSSDHLRSCVEPLSRLDDVRVTVVDNASSDGSLASVADLPVAAIARAENGGFAVGCNAGWRVGSAPYVLFLNPDASIDERSLRSLVDVLGRDDRAAAAAPRIEHADGSLAYSLRRFPRLRSTYARALFLHRVLPRVAWTDEVVRDSAAYDVDGSPEWVSGACVLVRRDVLEKLDGWDESFFLFGEDVDLCRRIRQAGWEIRFEPRANVVHQEGASAPSTFTVPLLATARIRYAEKHRNRWAALGERGGVALEGLLRGLLSPVGAQHRRAHLRSFRAALARSRPVPRP